MKIPSLGKLGGAAAAIIGLGIVLTPIPFRLYHTTSLSPDQAKIALRYLRQGIQEDRLHPLPSELQSVAKDTVPIVLTVWSNGSRKWVHQVADVPLDQAISSLATGLRQHVRDVPEASRTRLQLDFVVAKGWIPQEGLFASLAFVEGRDGVSGIFGNQRIYLPPSELIRNAKYGSFKPLPDYDAKFRVGIDMEQIKKTLAHQGRQIGITGKEVTDIARFRSLSTVEGENLSPQRLYKATVERGTVDKATLRAGILAGAHYLTRVLKRNGTFRYHYNPVRNRDEPGRYNWPRHAGVSYSLALVGRLLDETPFVSAAKRALTRFEAQLTDGPKGTKCLKARGKCYLGSSSLGLLALAEYRLASGDPRFDASAEAIAGFIKMMQKEDGFFYHDWYPDTGIDRELMKLYASQQAVFALSRYAKATQDKTALKAAVKGMDFLAGPYWRHFLGNFFFGQEHWSCLAAEEVYNAQPKPAYAAYCHDIGTHYDAITHNDGETPFAEDVGGMSITHMFTPHVGGTATAAEAMVSAVLLGDAIGKDTRPIRRQLKATFGYLLGGQVTADDTFWIKRHSYAIGGFYETHSKPKVRIDNVQHAISAMVRGMDLI
ncbi:MAG: hypothetical protein QNJ97_12145 [Myxococcota bacterium]|nr:hypothetical protein [Myxococcota bacterium]